MNLDMPSIFSRTENLIGLDIGTHSVKAVQMRSGDAKPTLLSMGIAPLPREAFSEGRVAKHELISDTIRQLLAHLKIKQKSVAVSVSGYDVMIKKIELPSMTEEELETRMHAELGQYIPYNIDEVDIDYQVLDLSKDRPNFMEVMLVAAKKESIADLNNVLKFAGLDSFVVDVDFFALGNAFEFSYGFEKERIAILDIGANKSIVNIMHKGVPVFTRSISIGGNQITDSIMDSFNLPFEEAEGVKLGESSDKYSVRDMEGVFVATVSQWVNECRRAIDFYFNNFPDKNIETFYLSGGSCRLPALEKVIQEKIEIPVEIFNPISRIHYDAKRFDPAYMDFIGPQMAIAFGLALRKSKEK